MNKEQFINYEIKKLNKVMYKDEDLMSPKEEKAFRKFFNDFINDLKKVARNKRSLDTYKK